jgi:hypothetical protein
MPTPEKRPEIDITDDPRTEAITLAVEQSVREALIRQRYETMIREEMARDPLFQKVSPPTRQTNRQG